MESTNSDAQTRWTMMVYLAGDNNLSEEMVWALQEMKKALTENVASNGGGGYAVSDFVKVIAQFDASGASPKLFRLDQITAPHGPHTGGELADLVPESLLSGFLHSVKPQPEQVAVARLHLHKSLLDEILKELPGRLPSKSLYSTWGNRTSLMISILTKAVELERDEPEGQREESMKQWLERLDHDIRALGASGLEKNALESYKAGSPIWSQKHKEEEDLGERIARAPHEIANSAQARAFEQFIERQVDMASRTDIKVETGRHMIVLSGHGSGAIGDFLPDSDPPGSLSIPKLGRLLQRALVDYRYKNPVMPDDMKISLLGMDSCLMSMVEVCAEVDAAVEVLIGSEGFVANTGWPYHLVLKQLADSAFGGSKGGMRCVAKSIVDAYTGFYRDYELAGTSTQIAAIDLTRFYPLQAEFRELVEALLDVLRGPFEKLVETSYSGISEFRSTMKQYAFGVSDGRARRVLSAILAAHWRSQTYKMGQYVDIWDFCANLRQELEGTNEESITNALGRVMELIEGSRDSNEGSTDSIVIASNYCGPEFQHSHGLSVYLPWSLEDLAPEYRNLKFDRETNWFGFLEVFLTLTQRERRGEYSFDDKDDPVPFQYGSDAEALVEELLLPPIRGRRRPTGKVKDGIHAAVRTGLHAAVRTGVHAAVRGGHHGDSRGQMASAVFEATFQNAPQCYYRRNHSDPSLEEYSGEPQPQKQAGGITISTS